MSNPSFELRRAGLADIPILQQVGADSYRPYYEHVWHPGGMEWYIDYCFNNERLTQEINSPNIEYYLPATPEGDVVGLLKLLPSEPIPDGSCDNAFFLEKIYLLPEFFGKGYGRQLIEMVAEMATALGREALWLQVMHNPGPISAYAHAGFKITGPTYFGHELLKEVERDGWVMVRWL